MRFKKDSLSQYIKIISRNNYLGRHGHHLVLRDPRHLDHHVHQNPRHHLPSRSSESPSSPRPAQMFSKVNMTEGPSHQQTPTAVTTVLITSSAANFVRYDKVHYTIRYSSSRYKFTPNGAFTENTAITVSYSISSQQHS